MTTIKFDRLWNGVSWLDYNFSSWTETTGTRFTRAYQMDGYELTLVGDFGTASGRPSERSRIFFAELEDANGDTMISVSGIDVAFRAFRNSWSISEYGQYGIENLNYVGSDRRDEVTGTDGNDSMSGNGGNDTLNGGSNGRDIIRGGSGNDFILGGLDRDILIGGSGVDRFVFEDYSDSTAGRAWRDTIQDFRHGGDVIDLRTIDAIERWNGSVANNKFTFIGREAFSGDLGELRFEIVRTQSLDIITVIHGDTEDGRGAELQIELSGRVNLTSTDFLL